VEAGRVGRPHGLDGSFHVTRPDSRLLPLGGTVTVAGAAVKIERRAGTEERPILRLEGHAGREAAEALRGQPLWVTRADLPELEADEYWAHELEGCAVVDGSTPVGVVRALVPLPSCDALAVERDGGGELLVPLVRDAIRSIDVAARRIDVDVAFLGES
jgi:16S rRNA processing protein RimM